VKRRYVFEIGIGLMVLGCGTPTVSLAYCQNSNAMAQQQCLALEAQQRSQQEAQQRAQQQAQQQAQLRAQQEAQQRAQQEAQQRAQQEAQQRAQQEAQQRAQQEAQQRAQQEAQQRAQQEAQRDKLRSVQQQSHAANPPATIQQHAPAPTEAIHATTRTPPTATTPRTAPLAHSAQSLLGGASKGAAKSEPKPVQLNASTKAIVRPDSPVMTVKQTNSSGTQVVMNRQITHGKSVVTAAYVSKKEAYGDRSKTYLDGHKIVYAKNGDIVRTSPNGVSVTTQRTGLRQAALPDGRPIYRERIEQHTVNGSTSREVVVRTDYARVVVGRPVFYPAPVIRRYDVVNYYGYPVLAYQPAVFAPVFFGPFLVGFPQPVFVTPTCLFCPAPVVAWQQPVQSYSDPVDLVADLQITSAVQDGMAEAPPPTALDSAPLPDDPQVADLRAQVSAIQQQVDAETERNADLRNQVAELQKNAPAASPTAFNVSEPVRRQIHKQVRDNISLHQEKRALTWPDIVASGDAPNYIFQVSDMLDATDSNGDECPVTTGDLLKLQAGTAPDQEVLRMHVVTSKSGSCPAGAVISVSIHDAQGMLNDFNQRQEANMQKLQPQIALANKG
jgi:hypothetical protein